MAQACGPAPPQGLVLFRGPSLLDGSPILCVATGLRSPSKNTATGPMIQTWIMRADVDPVTARRSGQDASVCGDCALRAGACYVLVYQAPLQVWKQAQAGAYPPFARRYEYLFREREIRLGSYGDPAAVPTRIWKRVFSLAGSHTGYTHQWRTCDQDLQRYLMASVETPQQLQEARALGWRTFRVRLASEPLLPGEFVCPKSHEYELEHGYRLLCIQCRACGGGAWTGQSTPVTIVHGSALVLHQFNRLSLSLTKEFSHVR